MGYFATRKTTYGALGAIAGLPRPPAIVQPAAPRLKLPTGDAELARPERRASCRTTSSEVVDIA